MPTASEILAARVLARRQSSGQQTGLSAAPAEETILSDVVASVGNYGLGVVSAVGNTLDLPGSIVRDVLAGKGLAGSVDQVLTPFTDENRTTGRQLLTKYGFARKNKSGGVGDWFNDPAEMGADLAGFGLEVFLDPFGPIGKTLKLTTAAGKAVKGAGRLAQGAVRAVPYVGRAYDVATDVARRGANQLFRAKFGNTFHAQAQKLAPDHVESLIRLGDEVQSKAMAVAGEMQRTGFNLRSDSPDYLQNIDAMIRYVEGTEDFAKQLDPNVKTLPDSLRPMLDGLREVTERLRAEEGTFINQPVFNDQAGIEYWPRKMFDMLKALVGKDVGHLDDSKGLAAADELDMLRDAEKYKGFYEGTVGVNKLLKDPQWNDLIRSVRDDIDKVGIQASPIVKGVGLIGPRHLKSVAEAVGHSPEDVWKMMGFSLDKPYAPYLEVRRKLDLFKSGVGQFVKAGNQKFPTQQIHGRGGWLYEDIATGKGAALRFDASGAVTNLNGIQPTEHVGDLEWDRLVGSMFGNKEALQRIQDARQMGLPGYLSWTRNGKTSFFIPRVKSKLEASWTKKMNALARSVQKNPMGEEEIIKIAIREKIAKDYGNQVIREMPHINKEGRFVYEELVGGLPTDVRKSYSIKDSLDPAVQQNITDLGLTQKMDDRYEALADLIVRREKVRELGVFGNNPVVDWADNAMGMARRTELARTLMKLTSDTLVEQFDTAVKPGTRFASAFGRVQMLGERPGGVTVKDLLDKQVMINETKFLNALALDLKRKNFNSFDFAPMKEDLAAGRAFNKNFKEAVLKGVRLDPKALGELEAMFKYYESPPEMKSWEKIMDSFMAVHKSGLLSTPSTVVRDGISAMVNGLVRGDLSLTGSGATRIMDGFSLAKGRAASNIDFPEVREMARSVGMNPDSADDRARAFVYLFSGAMHKSHMHAQLMNASTNSISASGQADSLLDAIPGQVRSEGALQSIKRMWGDQPIQDQLNPLNVPGTTYWQPTGVNTAKETLKQRLKRMQNPQSWQQGEWVTNDKTNIWAGLHGMVRGYVDNGVRMSSVLTQMDRGVPFTEAFRRTAQSQINYDPRTFTRFEREKLKRLFPFYSFISRSIPMVAMELATNPGGGMGQLIRAQRQAQGSKDDYVPYDLQDTAAINVGTNEAGDLVYIRNLGMMHEDALNYLAPTQGVRGILQKVIGSSNPIVKATLEYGMNTSTFFDGPMGGRRLDDLDPAIGRILNNMGLTDLPPSGRPSPVLGSSLLEAMAANSPAAAAIRYARVITEPTTRTPVPEKIMNLLSGVKTKHITREALVRELRDRLNAEQISMGARPITIVTGTEGLAERYEEAGQITQAERLKVITEQLNYLRKQIKQSQPTQKK